MGLCGGSSAPSTTTTVQQSDPWAGVQPYLTGGTGIYPEASRIYQNQLSTGYIGQSPEQRDVIGRAQQFFASPNVSDTYTAGIGAGKEALTGGFDPTLGQIRDVTAPQNNPWLQQQFQGVVDRAMQSYGDATSDANRAWTDTIAPGIRQGAQGAGQYGGTRQGIAEGVAASRLGEGLNRYARDLTQSTMATGANLFGNAYEQDMARQMQANLANAGMDVTRNQQEMQAQAQALQNRISGLGLTGQAIGGAGTNYDQLYGLYGVNQAEQAAARDFPMDALARYASIVSPGAGIGGTSSTSSPLYQNRTAGLLGGAATGAGLASGINSAVFGAGAMANPYMLPLTIGGGLLGAFG